MTTSIRFHAINFFSNFGKWREKRERKIEILKKSNLAALVNKGF